ncbi:DUF3455 domain-containing protein [Actinoplanes sp. NPDC049599]|uniref:DUF3455 domain-containing protein n=1 Tax=Actinoplanes sp. NPDC049599 TaxID=3363903 RepID=UPI0037BAECF4
MKTKSVRIAAGVGAVTLALVGISAGVSFADDKPAPATPATAADRFLGGASTVPANLVPPAGNALTSVFKAKGVQIYGCTDAKWALIEPAATLVGITLNPVKAASALHFRGPSWESPDDGSLVEGMSPVTAPSATPNSIPQLLVTAKLSRGPGVFGDVTFIQRLDTVGGVAPAAACTAGATAAVPYTAVYRFFKKS